MSEPPDLRASDSDRERIVERLREHAVEGRLTLEEFTERMAATYRARTSGELEELTRDLPSPRASVTSRRRPTRFLFSIFGSTEREGRIRMPRRASCFTLFGNIDLDLRQATLDQEVITIVAYGMFGAIDIYVPKEWRSTSTASRSSATNAHAGTTRRRLLARRSFVSTPTPCLRGLTCGVFQSPGHRRRSVR
jgi:hypothetical protein